MNPENADKSATPAVAAEVASVADAPLSDVRLAAELSTTESGTAIRPGAGARS